VSGHVIDAMFGFIGGVIPGGLHFAWKVTHNDRTIGGTIDLTYRAPKKKTK
jgi:hypothetical protein